MDQQISHVVRVWPKEGVIKFWERSGLYSGYKKTTTKFLMYFQCYF